MGRGYDNIREGKIKHLSHCPAVPKHCIPESSRKVSAGQMTGTAETPVPAHCAYLYIYPVSCLASIVKPYCIGSYTLDVRVRRVTRAPP